MLCRQKTVLCVALLSAILLPAFGRDIPLAGRWRFALDREDRGMQEKWERRTLPDSVQLPGCLTEQGIGEQVTPQTRWIGGIADKSWFNAPEYARYRQPGEVKIPFWLQPQLYYAGAAWFQREVFIPKEWEQQHVILFLERPHWETRVWLDGQAFGTNRSLATPHRFNLGRMAPGAHVLTIRVDNRMIVDIGENSHSITDHTQGNWNGIVGRIELQASPEARITDLKVDPSANRRVRIQTSVTNSTTALLQGKLSWFFEREGRPIPLPLSRNLSTKERSFLVEDEIELPTGTPVWDEFNPALITVRAELRGELNGAPIEHVRQARFGLREITTAGTQFLVNGKPTVFRGTLECAIFPKTGYPPTDPLAWKRILSIARAHGLNLFRFHSWCPPEAAFIAADELGFYFHVEASSWANQSTTLGDGQPVDAWVDAETESILAEYGNHPSFVLMLYGNEPGGQHHKEYLSRWVQRFSAEDRRRLFSGGAGWPQLQENQFHVTPDPRIQAWGAGLKSRINAVAPSTMADYRDYVAKRTVPVISHEIGEWCVYPDFDEMLQYTGYLKPRNFEIFRDRLEANGLLPLAREFLLASGKLQVLCYKEEIESALRTPGFGGFELLDLHDFPGQGTALVGVLNPFWESKGYVTAEEFRRFCNSTVPLARLDRRVFTTADPLDVSAEVSHFGPTPLTNAVIEWRLVEPSGHLVAHGKLPRQTIPLGSGIPVGQIRASLARAHAPTQAQLKMSVRGTEFANEWGIWIYPETLQAAPAGVRITSSFDQETESALPNGALILLTIPGDQVRNFDASPVKVGFSSIFWNTAWTGRQAPTTLGLLCDAANPALAEFPTESFSDWQWWYLLRRAGALRLDLLPRGTPPIVRIIDDWVTARPLGLMIEGRCGRGKIIVCGFDLTGTMADPVTRQMRSSLTRYLASERCRPKTELSAEQIRSLFLSAAETRSN